MALKSKHGFCQFSGIKSLLRVVVTILSILGGIEGSTLNSLKNKETEEQLKGLNKPAIKTIMSEDGDVIDCVDIYKQPAFGHPLLKNHIVEHNKFGYEKEVALKEQSLLKGLGHQTLPG